MKRFSGGCACGAIRYECKAPPIAMFNCHCRACQQASGGPYAPVVLVLSKAFKLTQGTPHYHLVRNVDGKMRKRGFCPDCGSRLTGAETEQAGRWLGVTASSLDDPSWFKPQYDIFVSQAQPWDLLDATLPKHEQHRSAVR